MDRMKTFGIYALCVILFFIFSNVMINVAIKATYMQIGANILLQDKIKIVINKQTKIRGLNPKVIIGGMAYYNDPSMSFMTELFNKDNVRYSIIPFDEQVYSKYLEGLVNCNVSLNGYPKSFMGSLKDLGNMVYPLLNNKYRPVDNYDRKKRF